MTESINKTKLLERIEGIVTRIESKMDNMDTEFAFFHAQFDKLMLQTGHNINMLQDHEWRITKIEAMLQDDHR